MTAVYDAALAPADVHAAQFGLLRALSATDGVSIQDLADRVDLERSTVARNVRVLERAGLVELATSAEDRRTTTVRLSDRGASTLTEGAPLWESAQRQIEQLLGAGEARALRATLHAL